MRAQTPAGAGTSSSCSSSRSRHCTAGRAQSSLPTINRSGPIAHALPRAPLATGAHSPASRRAAAADAAAASAADRRATATAAAPASASSSSSAPPTRVLIVGGTGRVGASAAWSLLTDPGRPGAYAVTLASRSRASYDGALARRPQLAAPPGGGAACAYVRADASDRASVDAAIRESGASVVVHAAGPFQGNRSYAVLEAAIEAGASYVDICDDAAYAKGAKALASRAAAAGLRGVTSAGLYPGVSNVMASHLVAANGEGVVPTPVLDLLRYSYYTAGSGGAGRTILETSLLLLGERAAAWRDGERFELPAMSNRREVDFGPGVGRKGTYLLNLPEVDSSVASLKARGASARFGTDPAPWNWGMWLLARLLPASVLSDRATAAGLAAALEPVVRLVDAAVGEKVAMLVEADFAPPASGGKAASSSSSSSAAQQQKAAALFAHKSLPEAVGHAVAAFVDLLADGGVPAGVWYPEEGEMWAGVAEATAAGEGQQAAGADAESAAVGARARLIQRAARGSFRLELNKPPWALESEVRQLGGLIYW